MYLGVVEESRRERKKQLTRRRIVMAAVRLFEEQGYEQTTVAEIAAVADVDPKTFFNYFRSKDEVLFNDVERDFDVLFGAIAERRPEEGPGEVLARAVQTYAAHRRPKVPRREPAELSAAARLALTTPALQAKGLYLLSDLQRRIAAELLAAFPGRLDQITAAAMTGAVIGAIQQASLASVQLGRSQDELWEAARRGLDVALHGLVSVRPPAESPDPSGERTSSS
ncbi:TetR/AcrR family transcriptional regulator [Saccharopolyspora elongata]|uniref:TetR family transcriptional regulator n=1 Tax=Saccharopolyspora elongata TaxID=2530387 RepID=A0A4R4YD51_9PSEU|nr:TetR/AcrR family transcriptional regulator [Saccharopolyspora elongata]TDD42565.1 TetR family transcriptional regulator [Saccharopolyspora elongata]